MAHEYLTTADVAVFNKTDMDILVNDVLNESPFLAALAARTVRGNTFSYTKETAPPSVGFRAVNSGIENKKATRVKVTDNLGVLDASFGVDVAAAQSDERGESHIMGVEAMSHLKQAMFEVEEQILNGTVGNVASNAFNGFADVTAMQAGGSMLVDATGSTVGGASSVYLVRTGEPDVQVLWGQSGEINIGDQQLIERSDGSGNRYPAYWHAITAWVGCKIASDYSVARIGNLTEQDSKGLTDALVYEALALFPASRQPNYIVMNRQSLKQLRESRTATNEKGAPAPRPTEVDGIPIIVTDALGITEAILA